MNPLIGLPILLLCICTLCDCYKFDQKYFGVTFTPYVKHAENGTFPDFGTYTFDNVKTMLTVITQKFSKVLVHGHFAKEENYLKNATYYTNSYISVRSGEAAAIINQERGKKVLSISIYLPSNFLGKGREANVNLSLESAEKANGIFPRTVKNIIFECAENLTDLEETLNYIQSYNAIASDLGVKLGMGQDCVLLSSKHATQADTMRKLVQISDPLLYGEAHNDKVFDPETSIKMLAQQYWNFKNFTEDNNKKGKIIGWTDWSSSGLRKWENVENLRKFWEISSSWAATSKHTLYMQEAFDNPFRQYSPREAHCGWWKLEGNSKINLVEGYIEKISENVNKKGSSTSFYYWITSTIVVSAILILIVAALVFRFIRGKKSEGLSTKEIRDFIFGTPTISKIVMERSSVLLETALNGPYDKALEIPKKSLQIDKSHLLGSGTFGCVFKALVIGKDAEPIEVAVKVANENCPRGALQGLLSEIKTMSYLGKHPNIVAMVGAYTAELTKGVVFVATELCHLGSLESYLRKNQYVGKEEMIRYSVRDSNGGMVQCTRKMTFKSKSSIPLPEMIQWAHEIACGMEYLETKNIVHADLATRNVLLTAEKTAKISDFGLSRRMYNYLNYVKTHQEPLPWRWMAIESLKQMEFSSKSDVWSYGVTLWEIFSNGDVPYQGLSWSTDFCNDLINGLRPGRPNLATPELFKLIQKCWSLEPNERPGFADMVRFTHGLLHGGDESKNDTVYVTLEV